MRNKKFLFVIVAVLSLLLAALVIFKLNHKTAAEKPEDTARSAVSSQFSFDPAAAPEWRQGPSNQTSMALFYEKGDCFVSFEHKAGAADENAALQKFSSDLVSRGHAVTNTGSQSLVLGQTGVKVNYTLHQFLVASTGSAENAPYRSEEFAYIPIANGHVFIQGYCDIETNLPNTIPALNAVTFKP